jgi:hypothetical protein
MLLGRRSEGSTSSDASAGVLLSSPIMRPAIGRGALGLFLAAGAMAALVEISTAQPARAQVVAPSRAAVTNPSQWSAAASLAVQQAVNSWAATAILHGVSINSTNATGGQVSGPALDVFIRPQMLAAQVPLDVTNAFATTVGNAWGQWASTVSVPGLPLYPAFAAVSGPVAPPTAGVPMPLQAFAMSTASVSAASLGTLLRAALGTSRMNEAGAAGAVTQFAQDFATHFAAFRAACVVKNIIGTGPVPSFAPPNVPIGPVVGGAGAMLPGGFAGTWPAS